MSFQILHSSLINSAKWTQSIGNQNSDVYNDFQYLNACTSNNWYGFIWGDYEKVLPYYQKKKWGLVPYICMPPFVQKFDTSHLTENEFNEVMSYFKQKNFIVDYRINDAKLNLGYKVMRNYILDKDSLSFEKLESNFSSLLRKNILKSAQYVDIDINASEDSIRFFLLKNELFIKLNKNAPWILDLPYISCIAARTKGSMDIEAALIYILHNSTAYLIAPYTSAKGRTMQAMTGLILHLIQDTSIDRIDFEGSSIDSIANFNEQFGAERKSYFMMNWRKI